MKAAPEYIIIYHLTPLYNEFVNTKIRSVSVGNAAVCEVILFSGFRSLAKPTQHEEVTVLR